MISVGYSWILRLFQIGNAVHEDDITDEKQMHLLNNDQSSYGLLKPENNSIVEMGIEP